MCDVVFPIDPSNRHRQAGRNKEAGNTMEAEKLSQLIARLHHELSTAETLDDDSRNQLQDLTGDIERLTASGESAREYRESTASQLEEAALRFESEHPRLSSVIGQLMDSLGKMGI
jgi:predicted  nucleic acid-binding Zn-ribbon protein